MSDVKQDVITEQPAEQVKRAEPPAWTNVDYERKAVPTPGAGSEVMSALSDVTGLSEDDPKRQAVHKKIEGALKANEETHYDKISLKSKSFTTKTTK